jgi:hypothetical protein
VATPTDKKRVLRFRLVGIPTDKTIRKSPTDPSAAGERNFEDKSEDLLYNDTSEFS